MNNKIGVLLYLCLYKKYFYPPMLDKLFNINPTIHKWDRFWVGLIPGLVLPLLGILFFYFSGFRDRTFTDYLHMVKNPTVLSPILSFGVIINLFPFFLFIRQEWYNAARVLLPLPFSTPCRY